MCAGANLAGPNPGAGKNRFRLEGRLVCAVLPQGRLAPDIVVRRVNPSETGTRARSLRATSRRGGGGFISAGPSEIVTESEGVVEMRVRAPDESTAARVALETVVYPLTAALVMATGEDAHVELTRVVRENSQGEPVDGGQGVWSDWAKMTDLGAMPPMDPVDQAVLARRLHGLRRDKTASGASGDLVEGTRMGWTSGGREAQVRAGILRQFMVIERIAKRVAADRVIDPSEGRESDRLIEDLRRDLAARPSTALAARRIKNTALSLEKQAGRRLSGDIEFAADAMGLDATTRDDALMLNRFRNQVLAHPGKSGPSREWSGQGARAERTARTFLDGYLSTTVAVERRDG
ncbi:MAG: hypothetical protein WA966_15580 [Ornithinimicrobium sp.]